MNHWDERDWSFEGCDVVKQLKCSLFISLSLSLSLSLLQVCAVQMCDVVNEIELARARCENKTAGNVTSGDVYSIISLFLPFSQTMNNWWGKIDVTGDHRDMFGAEIEQKQKMICNLICKHFFFLIFHLSTNQLR